MEGTAIANGYFTGVAGIAKFLPPVLVLGILIGLGGRALLFKLLNGKLNGNKQSKSFTKKYHDEICELRVEPPKNAIDELKESCKAIPEIKAGIDILVAAHNERRND